jgi:tryptophan-rich sensory protein
LVNALWTPLFFELKLRLVAFVWLLLLIILVVKMISDFNKVDKTASYLQIPYVIWLAFAAYLNLGVFILNN